jgi:probable HAF family extracellular repeat protein
VAALSRAVPRSTTSCELPGRRAALADATGTHGFLLSGGTYITLDEPLATTRTVASGINGSGDIVGYYDNEFGTHAFWLSGFFHTLVDPMATGDTLALGINASGQAVGFYRDASNTRHGFLCDVISETFTTLDDPLATFGTVANGINDMGQIVGYYFNNSGQHGFLYSGGTFTTIDDPLGNTYPQGINNNGPSAAFWHRRS